MTAQTVLKASTPADLVATLPYLFGFPPRDSIIVLAVSGNRIAASGRVDAAIVDDPEQLRFRMEAVARHGSFVILVVWLDPAKEAQRVATLAAAAFGGVDQTIVVSGGRCRADRGPWLDCHPSLPEAEAAGLRVLPDRAALAREVAGPAASDKQAQRQWATARAALGRRSYIWREARFDELLARGLGGGDELSVPDRTELAALVHEGLIRERVWDHFTADLAERHMALWRSVVSVVAAPGAPAALGLLAFAAWLTGEGALATCCCERGLGIAPDHSLLRLFETINLSGINPGAWSTMRRDLMAQRVGLLAASG